MGIAARSLVVVALAGCGEVIVPMPDAPATYTVVGNVTGFAGTGLVLQLNGGEEVTPTAEGAFGFTTQLASGATYEVTVKGQPACPQRRCTIANATGTIGSVDALIEVTCETPKQRLFSGNWGESSIRVTDNVLGLGNNATATPRIIKGTNTQITKSELDSVAFDEQRDILYMASGDTNSMYGPGVLVFRNASTLTGDVNYSTRITVANETTYFGVEVDPGADRLYVAGYAGVYVIDLASTLSGQVVPRATLAVETPPLDNPGTITLDRMHDRLYVGGDYTQRVHVFDNARSIIAPVPATRTVSWNLGGTFEGPPAVAIDACRDRLYLGSNDPSTNGFSLFAFDNASTLNGAIDPETASQARLFVPGQQAISAEIDSEGNLYWWEDSATKVYIHHSPHTWTGPLTVGPEITVNAVVQSGYGLEVTPYY